MYPKINPIPKVCAAWRGVFYCGKEGELQPPENYKKNNHSKDGLDSRCNVCHIVGVRNNDAENRAIVKHFGLSFEQFRGASFSQRKEWKRQIRIIRGDVTGYQLRRSVTEDLPDPILTESQRSAEKISRNIILPDKGWVYAIEDRLKVPGLIKIGSTSNLRARLKQYRTYGAFSYLSHHFFYEHEVVEKSIQRRLEPYKVQMDDLGEEWFRISHEKFLETIENERDTVGLDNGQIRLALGA